MKQSKIIGLRRGIYALAEMYRHVPVTPNLPLLQNAMDQTQGAGRHDARSWRTLVRDRLATLDMQAVCDDASPFLERPQDVELLTCDNLDELLRL
ncbi:MAG: hypothetical protein V1929_07555 [bacterium]